MSYRTERSHRAYEAARLLSLRAAASLLSGDADAAAALAAQSRKFAAWARAVAYIERKAVA